MDAPCSRARGEALDTLETEGQMIQRVMPDLMGMKNILVLNDEAHHCYREKPTRDDEDDLKGDDKEGGREEQRGRPPLDLRPRSGQPQARRARVIDLSATPFFLRGSGYAGGHAVPLDDERLLADGRHRVRHRQAAARARWPTTSPAARCRCSATSGSTSARDMPKKGRGKAKRSTRSACRRGLQTALEALYGHYEKTFELWQEAGIRVPPCFIVVCNNTATSKLVYDYISGFHRENEDGNDRWRTGASRCSATSTSTATRSARPTPC